MHFAFVRGRAGFCARWLPLGGPSAPVAWRFEASPWQRPGCCSPASIGASLRRGALFLPALLASLGIRAGGGERLAAPSRSSLLPFCFVLLFFFSAAAGPLPVPFLIGGSGLFLLRCLAGTQGPQRSVAPKEAALFLLSSLPPPRKRGEGKEASVSVICRLLLFWSYICGVLCARLLWDLERGERGGLSTFLSLWFPVRFGVILCVRRSWVGQEPGGPDSVNGRLRCRGTGARRTQCGA